MTINNPEAFCNGLWDWAILDGCFGGNIKPTDIEGFVERKGKFLVLETKALNVAIPEGQRRTFEALSRVGCFTIFVIWGKRNEPERLAIWSSAGYHGVCQIDLSGFRNYCSRWYQWADNDLTSEKLYP